MKIRLFISVMGVLAFCGLSQGTTPDISIDHAQRAFTIRTERLEATFKDGLIVNLKNLQTGELICDEKYADLKTPRGLGHLSGGLDAMREIHIPWGNTDMNQQYTNYTSGNYHYPADKSVFVCEKTESGVRATWTGLESESDYFPDESLTITAGLNAENGVLTFSASAKSDQGGVFGVVVPVANITPEARFYLSCFGGLRYDKHKKPALRTFGTAPFQEAPVMAAEAGQGSFAIWMEDETFSAYSTFFNWSGKSFSFAFESLNLMPFEPHKEIHSVVWHLDVFDGGWMKAMTPYKNWYANYFEKEINVRDSVEWAERISVVIDAFGANKETLDRVAQLFSPGTVLFHDWNARAPRFDTELPDWTPREGYVDKVKLIHEHGFKTMAYVNTFCVNYNSPVFLRDNLREKVLTRKLSIWKYGEASKDETMDKLIGDTQGIANKDQFEGIKDGRLLYTDPLSPAWRQYHVEQMHWWNTTTGTDANYEDTAGVSGDFGNGVVDGLSGAQGSVAIMRELLDRQPGVPMASEYGPDTIAFAVKWPLVYAQVWGNDAVRAFRTHAQVPVNAYLFGYRTWIPVINAGTDFLKHLITACSDATGGMGMTSAASEVLDSRSGFTGHMVWRAQLFAEKGLVPYFDPEIREPNLICMYRDREGGLYRYTDDGRLQRMIGPDGHEFYARVEKTNRLETALSIPGWPAVSGNTLFGLDPDQRYALFPRTDETRPPVQLDSLPEGIAVRLCRHDDDYALLVLDRVNEQEGAAQAAVPVTLNRSFETVCINGTTQPLAADVSKTTLDLTFPAYILFASAGPAPAFNKHLELDFNQLKIRKVSLATGLEEMTLTNNLPVLKRHIKTSSMAQPQTAIALWGAGWENNLDFLVRVPSRATSVRVYTRSNASPYGDGTIAKLYLNGACVKSLDDRSPNPDWKVGMPRNEKTLIDGNVHEWIVPVGNYAGQAVLITIASDPKRDGNSDQRWMSIPELIEDETQTEQDRVME